MVSSLRKHGSDIKTGDQVEERQFYAALDGRPGELFVARSLESSGPGQRDFVVVGLHPDGPWVGLIWPIGNHDEAGEAQSHGHDGIDDEEPSIGDDLAHIPQDVRRELGSPPSSHTEVVFHC